MERQHGSLIRAIARDAAKGQSRGNGQPNQESNAQSGARYNQFLAPRDGMSSWIDAIAAKLPRVQIKLHRSVTRIARVNHAWHVWHTGTDEPAIFDALIITAPAAKAAVLLEHVSATLATELRGIPYAGSSVAALGYRREQFARPPEGLGSSSRPSKAGESSPSATAATNFPAARPTIASCCASLSVAHCNRNSRTCPTTSCFG